MKRDYLGRYDRKDSVWPMVFGVFILAVFVLVLNHYNAARLDQYNNHICYDVYGLDNSCNAIN